MTTDASRNRQPAGIPVGGEFAVEERDDTAVLMVESDEQYDAGATFYFPNPPRSGKQMIAFWTSVQVPDPALGQLRTAYAERVKRLEDTYVGKYMPEQIAAWEAQNPQPVTGSTAMWHARHKAAETQIDKNLREHYRANTPETPKMIPTTDTRAAARAARMAYFLPQDWDEEERAEVLHTLLTTSKGKSSVDELVKLYRLDRLGDPFEEPTEAATRIMNQQTERLKELIDATEGVAEEVRLNTGAQVDSAEYVAGSLYQ